MLTERMWAVVEQVEQVEQLDEEEQDTLAAAIQAELGEDRHWEAAMDDPHDLVLDHLIAEAKEQVACGEARDLDSEGHCPAEAV